MMPMSRIFFCYEDYEWRRIWLNLPALLPYEIECWYHNIDIFYDNKTNSYFNNKGVGIRPIDFGGVTGVDYLDYELGIGISLTAYFAKIIAELKAAGYQVGKNLRAAPYDWRKSIDPDNFNQKLKQLVEETYFMNQNQKVNLISHSLGGVYITYFLNLQTQEWKEKYISAIASIATPWSGSPKALRAIISGDNFGIELTSWFPIIKKLRVRPMLRRSGGTVFLIPEKSFYNSTELIKTPTKSYSANNYHELFADLGSPVTSEIFDSTEGFMDNLKAPNVEMHCLYGTSFPTESHYTYNKGWDADPEVRFDEGGDGTIPEFSLKRCETFSHQQKERVEMVDFDLHDHVNILFSEELITYLLNVVIKSDK